jgi:histone demethylase JARID1
MKANGAPAANGTPVPLPVPGAYQTAPLSSRKAQSLDMSTVERRNPGVKEIPKKIRPHGLIEAPTYTPSAEEFKDPMEYIRSIAEEGKQYGIVKIIPPENWQPDFGIDTEVSPHFIISRWLFFFFSLFFSTYSREGFAVGD